jgi:CBS domain-containing protein
MKIRNIMTTEIVKATPDNTLADIALMMREEDTGVLPVIEDEELRGIVTDRDIVVRAIADGKDPSTTTVEEVLSEDIESAAPDDDVEKAADIMAARQIRRLPVVEGGQLIGMISLGDIAVKHEERVAAHALEGVSEGVKASGQTTKSDANVRSMAAGSNRASSKTAKGRETTRKKAA